jgi:hypothetical protein
MAMMAKLVLGKGTNRYARRQNPRITNDARRSLKESQGSFLIVAMHIESRSATEDETTLRR